MNKIITNCAAGIEGYVQTIVDKMQRRFEPNKYFSEVPPDFLIVGLQKSGTSWITALLANHPGISVIPSRPGTGKGISEGHFFDTLAKYDQNHKKFSEIFFRKHRGYFRGIVRKKDNKESSDDVQKLFALRYNAFLQSVKQENDNIVGDKTTEYVFHLELIDKLYPEIKKICVLRDPRDRIVSFHFHQLKKKRIKNEKILDYEICSYCDRVERELNILCAYEGSIKYLKYEDLLSTPFDVVSSILKYLGLDPVDNSVSLMIDQASFKKLSGRKQGEEDVKSHFRKGVAGNWKEHLTPEHITVITDRINPLLYRFMNATSVDVQSYC